MNYQKFIIKQNIQPVNAFEYLYKNFLPTIANHSYLVDWNRVNENRFKYEILLNILNTLLNLDEISFKNNFFTLVQRYPEIVEVFPILLATREKELEFIDENSINLNLEKYSFIKPYILNNDIVEHYYSFFEKTGLKYLFCFSKLTNLVDYVFGVEVGLNSNARKNRTGSLMETTVSTYLNLFCQHNSQYSYIEQATQKRIYELFGYKIDIDKNSRRFDFALFNKKSSKLYLIEVNFYSGGGSKLKATAGEYQYLSDFLKLQNIEFIWITDGKGWLTALNSLEETFYHNDYVINLDMVKNGILDTICLD